MQVSKTVSIISNTNMSDETPVTPAPAATPVVPEPVAPAAPAVVTLSIEEADQLRRDASRAAANQRKADLYDKNFGGGNGHFRPQAPATPPSQEEIDARAGEEDRKAERGLLAIAADPAFREVFDADPTLRDLMIKNPLAILPLYASDALDADDALTLVRDALTALKKPVVAPVTPPAVVETPAAPPSGGVNPSVELAPDQAYEEAKKHPNAESALAGMIGAKMKQANK